MEASWYNVLRTASQAIGIKLYYKSIYVNASLLLRIRVPAGFLNLFWTYGFDSTAVEV
jgi:hypothetical protein